YEHPYGSLGAAVDDLARARTTSPGGRSHLGAVLDRMTSIRSLGASVQTTRRHDRDTSEVRRTDLTIDVERCAVRVASRSDVRAGWCDTSGALSLLLDPGHEPERAEAWGVTLAAVRGVAKRARRAMTVELAARG